MTPSSKAPRITAMSKVLAVIGGATLAASLASGVAGAQPPDTGLDAYTPVDWTEYLVDDMNYYGSVFFQIPDGRMCGMYTNSGHVGCDAVPIDAPEGTNQVRAAVFEPGNYRYAEAPGFTVPGGQKVLPEGHKITLQNNTCGVGYQGAVACESSEHGFVIASTYGVIW
ncbi:hypothetical protein [Rhodococcus sp. NPDC058521]|uniref:hypothetical protein n=1 Tax=Rhodococcus sp. NPDC058521 TaxID=3346536 RepID=UPI003668F1CA